MDLTYHSDLGLGMTEQAMKCKLISEQELHLSE